MKKNLITVFMMLMTAGVLFSADMTDFINKANTAEKNLKIKEKEYSIIKKEKDYTAQKVNMLKAGATGRMWALKFINNIRLGYYLMRGNDYAYRANALDKEIKEMKEEYFTYSSLIIEEYDKKINECIKSKCPDLKNIYGDREKWMDKIRDYEDILQIYIYTPASGKNQNKQADEDFNAYLNKKLIQVEERIFILQDEKNIGKEVKAAGIKISQKETDELTLKIKKMEKIRETLEEKIKETGKQQ